MIVNSVTKEKAVLMRAVAPECDPLLHLSHEIA